MVVIAEEVTGIFTMAIVIITEEEQQEQDILVTMI
jgi:hypothetical protein